MFSNLSRIVGSFTRRERIAFIAALAVGGIALIARTTIAVQDHSLLIPVFGGEYIEGIVGQPSIVNPAISQNQADQDLAALVFAPLTDLASTILVSPDERTYTVKLKENLAWSDGAPLTSDDVVFTVGLIENPDAHSPLARSFEGVTVTRESELQVTFTLPAPYVFFRDNLARLSPVPKHIFGSVPIQNLRLSQYNLQPVGSGPYRFDSLQTRADGFVTRYNLVVNPRYAGQSPFIERFSFQFYAQASDLRTALREKQIDGFGSTFPPELGAADLTHADVTTVPMPRYYAIFMNPLNNPALKDDNLRAALAEAIDRTALITGPLGGAGTQRAGPTFPDLTPIADNVREDAPPAGGPTDSTTSTGSGQAGSPQAAATTTLPTYDLSAAQALFAKVANTDTLKLTLVVPNVPDLVAVADAVKSDWAAIGLTNVTVLPLEPDDLVNNVVKTRNYKLLLYGNVLENPADLFPFWHSSERFYPGLNLALYQNQKVDTLLETIRQSSTPQTRPDLLARAGSLIVADDPAVFLFSMPYFYVHTDQLEGFNPRLVVTPADRFRDVVQWSMAQVRIFK